MKTKVYRILVMLFLVNVVYGQLPDYFKRGGKIVVNFSFKNSLKGVREAGNYVLLKSGDNLLTKSEIIPGRKKFIIYDGKVFLTIGSAIDNKVNKEFTGVSYRVNFIYKGKQKCSAPFYVEKGKVLLIFCGTPENYFDFYQGVSKKDKKHGGDTGWEVVALSLKKQ